MQTTISKENFHTWKRDPVTKQYYKILGEIKEDVEDLLLSEHVLLGDQKRIAGLLYQKDLLKFLLNLNADELAEDREEITDEDTSSRT